LAVDFQIVFPQELVELTSVRIQPGMVPRTLDITGADFRAVDQVMVNDLVSPDVVVLSKTRLLAQVPSVFATQTISSVTVISTKLAVTPKSLLRFRVGRTPSKVSGLLRLMQVFLKLLFTTPGSDIFAPQTGAGALVKVGSTFGHDEGGGIVSDFVVAVGRTQRQILAIQARDPSLARDERLLAAKVLSAGFNRAESALIVSVELTSHAGRAAVANLTV
jgi:hypothetical protein